MGERRLITSLQRALVRDAYEGNADMTIAAIAAAVGISASSVNRLAREGRWAKARRGADAPEDDPAAETAPAIAPATGPSDLPQRRAVLIDALWRAVAQQVVDLKGPVAGGAAGDAAGGAAGGSAGGAGRARADGQSATALMTVTRTIEKLSEMDRGTAASAARDEPREDIDDVRARIARRLEALCEIDEGEDGAAAGAAAPDGAG